ncbi:MAG: hypothetical protein HY934_08755, partial [Candidatus Firestonebacteria bacterium]|nr:hypothetical protein [Candidatus Firestonebacteria bacterium]
MTQDRVKLGISLFLIVSLLGIYALACGGSRKSKNAPKEEYPTEAKNSLDEAYNIMENTDIAPPFMDPDKTDLTSFNADSTLPSPDKLAGDQNGDGNPEDFEEYENAIDDMNEAVNLIGAAKKTYYTANSVEKAYLHLILGYLFTVNAAERLVTSPLGVKVITYNKKYNINLPYKDNNKDGITDIEDINGENGSDLESDVKKSCTAILNAL